MCPSEPKCSLPLPASNVQIEAIPQGDVSKAIAGAHVVLEAGPGCHLHALNLGSGQLVVFRKGRVAQTAISKALPSAKMVKYPPPHGLENEEYRSQAVKRAIDLCGKEGAELRQWLVDGGASIENLADDGAIAETFCSYCVTGSFQRWHVMAAYHGGTVTRQTSISQPVSTPYVAAHPQMQQQLTVASAVDPLRQPIGGANKTGVDRVDLGKGPLFCSPMSQQSVNACPVSHENVSVDKTGVNHLDLGKSDLFCSSTCEENVSAQSTQQKNDMWGASHLKAQLAEGATKKVLQSGFHGPGARVAGAAAAVGCEAYRLYGEVQEKTEQLKDKVINKDQYAEGVTMCSVAASGRAMGGLAGAALGQSAIPIPVVGAVIGGVAGAVVGGAHSETFAHGIWRLSGNKAKADDQVKCIEHKDEYQSSFHAGYNSYDGSNNLACTTAVGYPNNQSASNDDEDLL